MTTVQDVMALGGSGPDRMNERARLALGLVLTCVALAGPIGYAGQNAYAPLVALCGVASLPVLKLKGAPLAGIGVLLALALWAALSMAWSAYAPLHGGLRRYQDLESLTALKLVLQAVLYGGFVLVARETPRRWADRILLLLTLGLGLITVVMIADALSGWGVYNALRLSAHVMTRPDLVQRNAGRGCFTVALLFWPAAVWLTRQGWLPMAVLLGAGLVFASLGLHLDAPVVALALGGLAFALVQAFGRRAVWALMAATLLYFVLTPAFFALIGPGLPHFHADHGVAKASWGARLDIWRFAAARIMQHPWRGWGIDASRVWPEIPLHPHDAALQLWLELGVTGAVLGAVFWFYVWARISFVARDNRADAGVFAAVATAYLAIGALSFGVWQEWWLALGAIAVVVCGVLVKAKPGPPLNLHADRRNEPLNAKTPHEGCS